MSCLGGHTAIEPEQMAQLLGADPDQRASVLYEIQEATPKKWNHELDKAWDALQRCLSDGTLDTPPRFVPLAAAVMGGEQLTPEGCSFFISLVRPEQVRAVADALGKVTQDWLRQRHAALIDTDYDWFNDDQSADFEYTWENFKGLPKLFDRAAKAGRAVIFDVAF